jgi:hypothetical protein
MKRWSFSLAVTLMLAMLTPAASASSFEGGFVDGEVYLSKSGSPYSLTSTVEISRGAKLTVEAGVILDVKHKGSVFRSAGTLELLGTPDQKIRVLNAGNLWETAGNFAAKSDLKMVHVEALGIESVFSALNQGQRLEVTDSVFVGDPRKSQPMYSWLTFCEECKIMRNTFRSLPGLWIKTYSSPDRDAQVADNLFIGNSTSTVGAVSKNQWLASDGSTRLNGNSFTGFKGPVLAMESAERDWEVGGNYFDGADSVTALNLITRDLSGYKPLVSSTLATASAAAPGVIVELPADPTVFRWIFRGQTLSVTAMSLETGVDTVVVSAGKFSSSTAIFSNSRKANLSFPRVSLPGKAPIKLQLSSRLLRNSFDLTKVHRNCASVWREFDGGIAKSASSRNKGVRARKAPTVFASLYNLNSKLDRDRDGIVCER